MKRLTPILSVLVVCILSIESVTGQIPTIEITKKKHQSSLLSDYFEDYSLLRSKNLKSLSTAQIEALNIQITNDQLFEIILIPSDLLSQDFKISLAEPELLDRSEIATPYFGFLKNDPESQVRLTIQDGAISGYIKTIEEQIFIEPATGLDKSLESDLMVIYRPSDVKENAPISCAAKSYSRKKKETSGFLKSAGGCRIYEIAIATDYSYRQALGGTQQAINQTIAIMNMVAGDYEGAFVDDVRFEIVEHYISNCSTCDPWSTTTNANALLNNFTNWGPSGFSVNHDIGQFWTARDICGDTGCGVAGLAWIDAVCGTWRYHILEHFSGVNWQMRLLVSHEMGHNFGSGHDGGTGYIMGPSILVNTSEWSNNSKTQVNNALAGFNCFENCVIGSCTEIISVNTTNCTPGNPSTYDLVLEIRHGGGGSAASFNVNVNGQSFNQSWQSSPQTVIINGLVADETFGNTVSISASDGSDSGCAGSATYDEPSTECDFLASENFNDCTIPSGWTESSTNIYIWNGGDPLLQYEWKFDDASRYFGNYGNGSNATSLKTIDGTCMAVMDDDIINHSYYTGEVILNTPFYDMSDYDTVQLSFDYNFHPFEDGGKGQNESFFRVEVYDGTNWHSVLTDSDSNCDWFDVWPNACTNFVELDLSNYKNSTFRIRFIYNDGSNGKWTGMVALDNVKIRGTVEMTQEPTCNDGIQNGDETGVDCGGSCTPCGDCESVVQINEANPSGLIEARDMIETMTSIQITSNTTFSADNTSIYNEFAVGQGIEFTISGDGCN